MLSMPSQEVVVQAVLQGIGQAKENYLFWTNNRLFLSYGPRKIITLHVAQALGSIDHAPEVFIDATVADILRCSLPDRTGYVAYMRENALAQGAFSITLDARFPHQNDNDSISKVIISVKNGVRNVKHEYTKEIERICKMLCPPETSLSYGIFAFYADLSMDARKKLSARIPQIVASFDRVVEGFETLQGHFVTSGISHVAGMGEWCAGCYVIEPRC
ncbi:MAG: hypothetical protein IBX45_08310 [Campylobacterales bacterium]|nr:hypothetical protein [Campylobacterales bacterium]